MTWTAASAHVEPTAVPDAAADPVVVWTAVLDDFERSLDAHAAHLEGFSRSGAALPDLIGPPPFVPPAHLPQMPGEVVERTRRLADRNAELIARARAMSVQEPGPSSPATRPRSMRRASFDQRA